MTLSEKVETAIKYLYERKRELQNEIDWIDRCIDAIKQADKK